MKLQLIAYTAVRLIALYVGLQALFFIVQLWSGYAAISGDSQQWGRYMLMHLIPGLFMICVSILLWLVAEPLAIKLVGANEEIELGTGELKSFYPMAISIIGLAMLVSVLPELISTLISIVAERDLGAYRLGHNQMTGLLTMILKALAACAMIVYARKLTSLISKKQSRE